MFARFTLVVVSLCALSLLASSVSAQKNRKFGIPDTAIKNNADGSSEIKLQSKKTGEVRTFKRDANGGVFRRTDDGSGQKKASDQSSGRNIIGSIRRYDISDPKQAFYGLNLPQNQLYRGIIPGVRDTLPHISRQQKIGEKSKKSSRLTWIGFQRMEDKSRVFLQTHGVPAFQVERGKKEGEVIVILQNTRPATYNFKRNMDTRWFPRAITGIRSYQKGKDTHVSIQLRSQVEFSIVPQGNYLYMDFDDTAIEKQHNAYLKSSVYDDPDKDNVLRDLEGR